TISGNTAEREGGGIRNGSGGTLNVTNSTISGNHSSHEGGGIENVSGTLNVTNSTISGNHTDGPGGGIVNAGTVHLFNATVADNRAKRDQSGSEPGGCIPTGSRGSTATLRNAIVARNQPSVFFAGWLLIEDDCRGTLPSEGYNLLGYGDACGPAN